jgi:hypothetical protein
MSVKSLLIVGIIFVAVGAVSLFGVLIFLQDTKSSSLYTVAYQAQERCKAGNIAESITQETCYARVFEDISFEYGVEYAVDVLLTLQNIDPEARGCHFIGHGIGYGAYKRNPDNWREDIVTVSGLCSYGIPMGIIEQYVISLPKGAITLEFVPTICGPNPRADCNHIVGHILLADTSVQGDIDKALQLCSAFEGNDIQMNHCVTGVFMEHMTAFNLIEHGYAPESYLNWAARAPEIEKVCRSYEGKIAEACWEEIPHVIAVQVNNNASQVFAFCNTAPTQESAERCVFHSLGILAGAHNFIPDATHEICNVSLSKHYGFPQGCYKRMVASILSSIPQEVSGVIELCSGLTPSFQKSCFEQIGFTLYGSKQVDLEFACKKAPSQYYKECVGTGFQGGSLDTPRNDLNFLEQ